MPGIFISYRRSDSGMAAGRLYDHLSGRFGASQVFMDVTTLGPGENFVETIRSTIDKCDVMLAVIGRQWLTATDESGQRYLDNPEDYVRQEIGLALHKRIRVIPVLVDGATMPNPADLPPNLKRLSVQNGLSIRNESFKENINFLMQTIFDFRASAEPPLSLLEHTAPFPAVLPPIPFIRQKRNQWIWVAVVLILLPLNCIFGAVPILVGTLILATLVPVAWPFARNMILIAQIATVIVLAVLFALDYQGITSGNGPILPILGFSAVAFAIILNLIAVRRVCRKSLFEMQPNR